MNITEYLLKFTSISAYATWAQSSNYVYPSVCKAGSYIIYNNTSKPLLPK
jgi:hypothetical protein